MKKIGTIVSSILAAGISICCIGCTPADWNTGRANPDNISCFGWEGDLNAPFIYMDGSFYVRERDIDVNFGVSTIKGSINWYLNDGYLPCFVSEYSDANMSYILKTFGDKVTIGGKDFVIAYTSMKTVNNSGTERTLPEVNKSLVPLGGYPAKIASGGTITRYYAIAVDKFGGSYDYPVNGSIAAAGDFNTHYTHMKNYWNKRLEGIVNITSLPDSSLINAYKAGYIFTQIVKDGNELHVGENNYDRVFDHDCIGMLATLVTIGDFKYFEEYASHILDTVQYPDARWKFSFPYALYLEKTGDTSLILRNYDAIKENTRHIERERTAQGVMKKTNSIDAGGYWLIDNWSALTGLTTYEYINDALYAGTGEKKYLAESQWAAAQYASLFNAVESTINNTVSANNLSYLPASIYEANTENRCKESNDANWAAHFLFGRWAWDGYLFGAEQDGVMLSRIDDTYAYGFNRLKEDGYADYTFGGFPGECSAYNAGYGSAALRGEEYRDVGIKAYEFMIQNTQSAPFSWWECALSYDRKGNLTFNNVNSGWGSCPHMWGQSVATKVLVDSLISEKADGTLIIGRGIPEEWITDGERIALDNYPTRYGRFGYSITTSHRTVTIQMDGNHGTVSIELLAFKNNIASASGLTFNKENGSITVPSGVNTVIVTLAN
jgi:hypothetical protein